MKPPPKVAISRRRLYYSRPGGTHDPGRSAPRLAARTRASHLAWNRGRPRLLLFTPCRRPEHRPRADPRSSAARSFRWWIRTRVSVARSRRPASFVSPPSAPTWPPCAAPASAPSRHRRVELVQHLARTRATPARTIHASSATPCTCGPAEPRSPRRQERHHRRLLDGLDPEDLAQLVHLSARPARRPAPGG